MGLDTYSHLNQIDNWGTDQIIDGLIGYSLHGPPRETAAEIIVWVNEQHFPLLSQGIPSGIDADRWAIYDPAIKACASLNLALHKIRMDLQLRNRFLASYTWQISAFPQNIILRNH